MELRPLTIDNCERTLARGLRRWSRCQNEASLEGVSVRLEELPARVADAHLDTEQKTELYWNGGRGGNEIKPWDFRKQRQSNLLTQPWQG
jgi:hypothetical protein